MPAFTDEFTFFWNYAATAYERDPYTWSGLFATDAGDYNEQVAIGGMYMAAFFKVGSGFTPADPRDDGSGLRPISARLRVQTRCDYNQSPGYAGTVYPLVEYVAPETAWWANLSGKLGAYSIGQTAAPSSSDFGSLSFTILPFAPTTALKY